MKKFCIAGPINLEKHYSIPQRLDLVRFDELIKRGFCFGLNAPRQSGKTTGIKEYVRYLNAQNTYTGFYLSCETAHNQPTVEQAFIALCYEWRAQLHFQHPDAVNVISYLDSLLVTRPFPPDPFLSLVRFWSQESSKPLVIFLDEVDGLTGDSLISFFKQVRTGFSDRPKLFPQSMGLISLRDLRDYKVKAKEDCNSNRNESPFNSIAESVRLDDFTKADVEYLYGQHTQATGQVFTEQAIDLVYCLTQGQPWLVNALAFEACFRDVTDRSQPITGEVIKKAKKRLILRRDTHLDVLLYRLHDRRVRVVIDAIISGRAQEPFTTEDIQYTRDLGLIKRDELKIANPIYQEVIPRELTFLMQSMILEKTLFYVDHAGNLNMQKLLQKFTQFYRENSHDMLKNNDYKESGPHFVLMAWLQRIVNGGGDVRREYAYGNKHLDLLVLWKEQRIVIEIKIYYSAHTLSEGIAQTAAYMDMCQGVEGHLVIFDRDPHKSWDEKISYSVEQFENKSIHVWQL